MGYQRAALAPGGRMGTLDLLGSCRMRSIPVTAETGNCDRFWEESKGYR